MIPNTTPTPNLLFNGEMKKMSDPELRVVMIVTRATFGWIADVKTGMRKEEDWISHSQMVEKSGKSSRAISYAIASCIKNDWIEARDEEGNKLEEAEERRRHGKKIFYRLGSKFLGRVETIANGAMVEKHIEPSHLVQSTIAPSANQPSHLVRTTKETHTKETHTQNNATQSVAGIDKEKIPIPNAESFFKDGREKWDGVAMSTPEFVLMCRASKWSHIRLIGEYADERKPEFSTRGQWKEFGKRNMRPARRLSPYTEKQLDTAISRMNKDLKANGGFISKWSLETLEKYLD